MIIDASGGGNTPVPPGEYPCTVVEAGIRDSRSSDGQYCELQLDLDMGRKLWDRPMVKSASDVAVNIGLGRLKALARSTGLDPSAIDPAKLQGQRAVVVVELDRKDPDSNQVKTYKPLDGAAPTAQPTESANADSGEANATPAWKRTD